MISVSVFYAFKYEHGNYAYYYGNLMPSIIWWMPILWEVWAIALWGRFPSCSR